MNPHASQIMHLKKQIVGKGLGKTNNFQHPLPSWDRTLIQAKM